MLDLDTGRHTAICQLRQSLEQLRRSVLKLSYLNEAGHIALGSLVQELAEHAGIGSDAYERHYQFRARALYEAMLHKMEDMDPETAAFLDDRAIEEIELPDVSRLPRLFEPPPEKT